MAARRRTLYLNDDVYRLLRLPEEGAEGDREYSFAGRVGTIIARYDRLIADAMPAFTRGEWCAVMDANNGGTLPWGTEDLPASVTMVWANLADSRGMDEKWGVDSSALVGRLRGLPLPAAMAVVEAIDRFWSAHEKPTDEALKVAGVRIVGEAARGKDGG
jgi:hypothetical protein